jgi:predicted ester cyclase
MADNATLARRMYEAFNERNFDELAEATAPDATITVVGSGDTYEGPEGSRAYNTMWANGFPDGSVTVDRLLESGDHVIVEFTGRGTHTGTLVTSMGQIPPTGRSVTLQFCDIVEFRDGKTGDRRTYFDTGSMMAQLGLMSEQATSQHP